MVARGTTAETVSASSLSSANGRRRSRAVAVSSSVGLQLLPATGYRLHHSPLLAGLAGPSAMRFFPSTNTIVGSKTRFTSASSYSP